MWRVATLAVFGIGVAIAFANGSKTAGAILAVLAIPYVFYVVAWSRAYRRRRTTADRREEG
jgi:uncharacterized protein (DUF2062 family)